MPRPSRRYETRSPALLRHTIERGHLLQFGREARGQRLVAARTNVFPLASCHLPLARPSPQNMNLTLIVPKCT